MNVACRNGQAYNSFLFRQHLLLGPNRYPAVTLGQVSVERPFYSYIKKDHISFKTP